MRAGVVFVWLVVLGCGSRTGMDLVGGTGGASSGGSGGGGAAGGSGGGAGGDAGSGSGGAASDCRSAPGLFTLAAPPITASPGTLAVDDTSVYFVAATAAGAEVMKVPLCGGAATTVVKVAGAIVSPLGLAAPDVYFSYLGDSPDTLWIAHAPLDGGGVANIEWIPPTPFAGLAVSAGDIYLTTNDGVDRLPFTGVPRTTVVSGHGPAAAIALDASNVYATTQRGELLRAPLGGGAATTLGSTNVSFGGNLAVDAANVYWAGVDEQERFTILRTPIDGGATATLATSTGAPAIATDGTSVYWTDAGAGTVMKVATGGGTPVPLATAQNSPAGVAVDATSVYWTNQGSCPSHGATCTGNAVMKLTPK